MNERLPVSHSSWVTLRFTHSLDGRRPHRRQRCCSNALCFLFGVTWEAARGKALHLLAPPFFPPPLHLSNRLTSCCSTFLHQGAIRAHTHADNPTHSIKQTNMALSNFINKAIGEVAEDKLADQIGECDIVFCCCLWCWAADVVGIAKKHNHTAWRLKTSLGSWVWEPGLIFLTWVDLIILATLFWPEISLSTESVFSEGTVDFL